MVNRQLKKYPKEFGHGEPFLPKCVYTLKNSIILCVYNFDSWSPLAMLTNNEMALHNIFCIIFFRQIQSRSALDRHDGRPPIRVSAFGAISDAAFLCFAPP